MNKNGAAWLESVDRELREDLPSAPELVLGDGLEVFRRLVESRSASSSSAHGRVSTSDAELGGGGVRVRTYTPDELEFTVPVVYLHPGGFVAGSIESADSWVRQLCTAIGAAVTSVDYSLAPEQPYPSAVHDVASVIRGLAHQTGGSVAVVGDSAGAGLAAAVALRARDEGSHTVGFLCMTNPALDDRLDTRSAKQYVDTPLWSRSSARASWKHYLRSTADPGMNGVPAYAAPGRAEDLSGMPPTFVMVSHLDPLRDEGIEFAVRLLAADVPTELHMFPGTFHGSRSLAHAEVSEAMVRLSVRAIRRALVTMSPISPNVASKKEGDE